VQADAILNMRLAKLTKLEQGELKARLAELADLIKELRALLKSEERQLEVMLEELNDVVVKYGDERRTVILKEAKDDEEEGRRRGDGGRGRRGLRQPRGLREAHVDGLYRAPSLERKGARRDGEARGRLHRAALRRAHARLDPVLHPRRPLPLPPGAGLPESGRASRGQSAYSLLTGADRADRIVAMLPVDDLRWTACSSS
jgi:DNA gyrase/topoisomerase IV subunit A